MSQKIIQNYKIKAKKSLGQNFLVDKSILDKISLSLDIKGQNVLEIGPGYGALTEKLLNNSPKSLHLVELDNEMIQILKERIQKNELITNNIDFQIFNEDILKFIPNFKDNNYYVIANIPYYITSPILFKFLYETKNLPKKMVILLQKDVADKISEGQNSNKVKSSYLSLFISKKCYVKSITFVPSKAFLPAPKVDSEVLLFETHKKFNKINDTDFLKLLKIGFKSPRKKLINNLENGGYKKEQILEIYKKSNLSENVRGEELDILEWIDLFKNII
ncbi:MAG: 16S rRNA (adenine(1518)-N(6)/adenine(1519)-N(6))-dimethyltransferase RsmA [Candidatus Gracilibacteria bacterium]|nr:16S rRNA (adenine(1518)-N(6)/adenine(1519)-N(6))-dimethyltransferase RsmA [Candidatus Gracilibacteria bacterium]